MGEKNPDAKLEEGGHQGGVQLDPKKDVHREFSYKSPQIKN